MRSLAGPARPNARRLPIGSLLALSSPFYEAMRRQRLGQNLADIGKIVAAGGAIRLGELGNENPRRCPTGAQLPPAKELTEDDRQALARAEDKRARKRFKRALMNANSRPRQQERMDEAAQLRLVKEAEEKL